VLRELLESPHRRVAFRGRLLRPWWRRRFQSFGEGSVLDRPRWIVGAHEIAIGDRVTILQGAWLAAERDAWGGERPAISIGDDVTIRTDVTISAAAGIEIEDGVLIAGGVTIVDSDHTMDGGAVNPAYNPLRAEPIRIGRGSWLAEGVVVTRGSVVGEGCVIGANAVVRGDIPPHSVAAGAPARVVGSTLDAATD
jgi:acetyltransferase-like isoleucine patch superfamily enzyme